MRFIYKGYNAENEKVRGKIEAQDRRDALFNLKRDEIKAVYFLREKPERPLAGKLKELVSSRLNFKVNEFFSEARTKVVAQSNDSEIVQLFRRIDNQEESKPTENKQQYSIFIDEPEEKPEFKKKQQERIRQKIREKSINWDKIERPKKEQMRMRIKPKEIQTFTKQLSVLLASGVTLVKALSNLQKNTRNKKLIKLIKELHNEVQEGNSLSFAMSRFPNQFNQLYLSLVSVGEASGSLDKCLKDLAEFMRTQLKITRSIKSAMIYPAIILVVVFALMVGGSYYFIPLFSGLFEGFDMELPRLTQAVFWIANQMQYVVLALIALIAAGFISVKYISPVGDFIKITKDQLSLKLPVAKVFVDSFSMFYFSHSLALMLRSGVRLIDCLKMTMSVVPNYVIQVQIEDVMNLLVEGTSFHEALSKQPNFSSVVTGTVSTGEETGRLGEVLQQISDYYAELLDHQIVLLTQWIQPISILIIAAIVIPIVFALFIPMLDLTSGAFM